MRNGIWIRGSGSKRSWLQVQEREKFENIKGILRERRFFSRALWCLCVTRVPSYGIAQAGAGTWFMDFFTLNIFSSFPHWLNHNSSFFPAPREKNFQVNIIIRWWCGHYQDHTHTHSWWWVSVWNSLVSPLSHTQLGRKAIRMRKLKRCSMPHDGGIPKLLQHWISPKMNRCVGAFFSQTHGAVVH